MCFGLYGLDIMLLEIMVFNVIQGMDIAQAVDFVGVSGIEEYRMAAVVVLSYLLMDTILHIQINDINHNPPLPDARYGIGPSCDGHGH